MDLVDEPASAIVALGGGGTAGQFTLDPVSFTSRASLPKRLERGFNELREPRDLLAEFAKLAPHADRLRPAPIAEECPDWAPMLLVDQEQV